MTLQTAWARSYMTTLAIPTTEWEFGRSLIWRCSKSLSKKGAFIQVHLHSIQQVEGWQFWRFTDYNFQGHERLYVLQKIFRVHLCNFALERYITPGDFINLGECCILHVLSDCVKKPVEGLKILIMLNCMSLCRLIGWLLWEMQQSMTWLQLGNACRQAWLDDPYSATDLFKTAQVLV